MGCFFREKPHLGFIPDGAFDCCFIVTRVVFRFSLGWC